MGNSTEVELAQLSGLWRERQSTLGGREGVQWGQPVQRGWVRKVGSWLLASWFLAQVPFQT